MPNIIREITGKARQVQRIENTLKQGYLERSKRRAAYFLTPGRRRMLELQLKKLFGCSQWLWQSKLADDLQPGRNLGFTLRGGQHITAKPTLVKGQVIKGTYCRAKHGTLKKYISK